MFTDKTTLAIGDVRINIRRMTIKEIREAHSDFVRDGEWFGDEALKIVESHCTIAGTGKSIDPAEFSLPQLRQIMTELVGIPEGSPISDFIGLLC